MGTLLDNLDILKEGKQKVIDAINNKLQDSDKQVLDIDCSWEEIVGLLSKIKIKQDHSAEVDANKIYTEICSDTRTATITTNVTSIGDYSLYKQTYLPELIANNCKTIGRYALSGCSSLTNVELNNCTSIGNDAFAGTTKLNSINLPKITSISENCFSDSGITTATLPLTVTINSSAFQNCSNLTTVDAAKVTTINSYAFQNCSNLNSPELLTQISAVQYNSFSNTGYVNLVSESIKYIYDYAFTNCKKLETIDLVNCTSISCSAFYGCTTLRSVNLPNVTAIGSCNSDHVFSYCNQLEQLYLPKATTVNCLASSCTNLTSISLPALTSAQGTIVYNNPNLTNIYLPMLKTNYVGTEGYSHYMFDCNYKLASLDLPNFCGSTTIKAQNFSSNYSSYFCMWFKQLGITKLDLSKVEVCVPYYRCCLITDCRCLTAVDLSSLTYAYSYDSNYQISIIQGCPNLTELTLPALVDCGKGRYNFGIWESAYMSNDYACREYIEQYMQFYKDYYPDTYSTNSNYIYWYERRYGGTIDGTLENAAPYNEGRQSSLANNMRWSGLKVLKLPKLSVLGYSNSTSYPRYFCNWCTDLEEIWLGDGTLTPSTQYIPFRFTSNCYNLKRVVLNYPVVMSVCTSLDNIFYYSPHLTGTQYSFTMNFNNTSKKYYFANAEGTKDLVFYVPDDLVESYRSATNWSTYADQIWPISDLYGLKIDTTTINEHQYENDQTITTAFGMSVTEIGDYAFYNTTLTSAVFSKCTSVGDYAFAKSTTLKELLLSGNLTKVGKYAFSETAISTINYRALTNVPEGMFKDCTSLKTCTLAAVTNVGKWALQNTALTSISYDKLIRIEEGAFKDCLTLATVTLPKVVAIEKEAFMNDVLESLSLSLVTSIKDSAFANNKLTEISIPNITILGDRAFANNSELTSINLYAISSIGEDVFDGCAKLTDITFTGYSVPVCAGLPENCTLHVRTILVDDFKVAFPNNTVVGDAE